MTATVDLARALHSTIDARIGLALPINPVGRARGTVVEVHASERTATILRAGETIPVRAKYVLLADTLVPGDDVLLDEVPGSLPLIVGILARDLVSGLGIVSVLTHGAKGDGRTDDLAACQRALSAGAGGIVIFPGGRVYILSAALVVPAGTTLLLHGATLRLQGGVVPSTLLDVQASTEAEPIRIEGGTLDGNREDSAWDGITLPSYYLALVSALAGSGFSVEGTTMEGHWVGVAVTTGTRWSVVGCAFDDIAGFGIWAYGDLMNSGTRIEHAATIRGNRFTNQGVHAIGFGCSTGSRITDNDVVGMGGTTRIDVYPDEVSGLLIVQPHSGSPAFTAAMDCNYIVCASPDDPAEWLEMVCLEKVSDTSMYGLYIAGGGGGARSTFSITSVGLDGIVHTAAAHGLAEDDTIAFTRLEAGSGLNVSSVFASMYTYHVIAPITSTSFMVSTSSGGGAAYPSGAYTDGFAGIILTDEPASYGTGDLASFGEVSETVIGNNRCRYGVGGGLVVFGNSEAVTITGNTCRLNGYSGISIAIYTDGTTPFAPTNVAVTGNTVVDSWRDDPDVTTSWRWSIQVIGDVTGVIVGNNVEDDGVSDFWLGYALGTPDVEVGHNRTVGHINPGIGP